MIVVVHNLGEMASIRVRCLQFSNSIGIYMYVLLYYIYIYILIERENLTNRKFIPLVQSVLSEMII